MDYNLGIAGRDESMACFFETRPQLTEVVDLSVEEQPESFAFVSYGLVCLWTEVDDAQPPMAEYRTIQHLDAASIWPAVVKCFGHGTDSVDVAFPHLAHDPR
jgi:hypothetical protein